MNLLIEASAGTGKTHQLVEYLVALLKQGVKPQEIVALTFSRAAAGEIFARFVTRLARGAATDAHEAATLRNVIATQHLSQIGTLDSFLMRILRVFPLELGLLGEIEIMGPYSERLAQAQVASTLLHRTGLADRAAFDNAFRLAKNHENAKSFVQGYKDIIATWHTAFAANGDPRAWGDPRTIFGEDVDFLVSPHEGRERLQRDAALIESIFAASPDREKWRDVAHWVRSFTGSFSNAKGITNALLEKIDDYFDGHDYAFTFNRKTFELSRDETKVVRQALRDVFACSLSAKLRLAQGYGRLLDAFEKLYETRVRARGHLVFADVPRLIAALPDDSRLALEYRTDSHIRAWALDEFQDTSREQWKALANLIDEAKQSDGEKAIFIVGDTKQAIYGWRNGDISIFQNERDSGFYDIRELNETRRSGPAIVEAVNAVFSDERGLVKSEFPDWSAPLHTAHDARIQGFVRLDEAAKTGPRSRKEDFIDPVFRAIEATVGLKEDDPRRRGVSTAILVRGNDLGKLLADELKRRHVEGLVWEGESDLLSTSALSGFLDLVQLADHPTDALAYRHFQLTPLAHTRYPDGVPSQGALSLEMAKAFAERGLVRTFRELRGALPKDPDEAWDIFTETRYTDMLRAAAEFELILKPDTHLSDFEDYLASQKKRTHADEGKIRIMTIHHAKGLGFDYVIVPLFESTSLDSSQDKILQGDGWVLPMIDRRVAQLHPRLQTAFERQKRLKTQEELCTYYVAFTRAKKAMTIILSPRPKDGKALRFSEIVRRALVDDTTLRDKLEHREITSLAPAPEPTTTAPTEEESAPVTRAKRADIHRLLPSLHFDDNIAAETLFGRTTAREEARRRGVEGHARMEKTLFSPAFPRPKGFVELWREKPFEVFLDGAWMSGRFDRVTFFTTPDGLAAEIIDFKSSLKNPERHAPQLEAYRRAVAALTGIPLTRISARLCRLPEA